jgi:hypothetical protein
MQPLTKEIVKKMTKPTLKSKINPKYYAFIEDFQDRAEIELSHGEQFILSLCLESFVIGMTEQMTRNMNMAIMETKSTFKREK